MCIKKSLWGNIFILRLLVAAIFPNEICSSITVGSCYFLAFRVSVEATYKLWSFDKLNIQGIPFEVCKSCTVWQLQSLSSSLHPKILTRAKDIGCNLNADTPLVRENVCDGVITKVIKSDLWMLVGARILIRERICRLLNPELDLRLLQNIIRANFA